MGESAGHPFRGNQYTSSYTSARAALRRAADRGSDARVVARKSLEAKGREALKSGRRDEALGIADALKVDRSVQGKVSQPVGPYSKSLAERDAAYKAARVAALAERTPAQKQAAALAASRLGTPAQGPTRSYGDEKRERVETISPEQLAGHHGSLRLPTVLKVTERGVNVSRGDYQQHEVEDKPGRNESATRGRAPLAPLKPGESRGRSLSEREADIKAGLMRGGRSRVRNAANRTKRTW